MSNENGTVSVSSKVLGWIAAAFAGLFSLVVMLFLKKNTAEAKNEISSTKIEDAKLNERHEATKAEIAAVKAEKPADKLGTGQELSDWFNKRAK